MYAYKSQKKNYINIQDQNKMAFRSTVSPLANLNRFLETNVYEKKHKFLNIYIYIFLHKNTYPAIYALFSNH